ncbi:hypothetical protein [Maricaulis sp.]|uniref:hypothetical protein n=1 Tax=Maricaulis sp. TaxID=1486257 RepID=UPI003A92D2FE
MKVLLAIPALILLAACSQPEAAPVYDADHLASSDACFADDRAALLEPGQTLIERGPDGAVRIAHALGGERASYEFFVSQMTDAPRQALDAAAADFYRAAGQQHDVTTDAVIYHRATDGTFCAVVRDEATGRALVDAAAAIPAGE